MPVFRELDGDVASVSYVAGIDVFVVHIKQILEALVVELSPMHGDRGILGSLACLDAGEGIIGYQTKATYKDHRRQSGSVVASIRHGLRRVEAHLVQLLDLGFHS